MVAQTCQVEKFWRSELESGDQSEPFVARSRGHFSAQMCILQQTFSWIPKIFRAVYFYFMSVGYLYVIIQVFVILFFFHLHNKS